MELTLEQANQLSEEYVLDMMRPHGTRRDGLRQLITDHLKPGDVMAEVGVFAGAATRMFYERLGRKGTIYAVDNFETCGEPWAVVVAEKWFDHWATKKKSVVKKLRTHSLEAAQEIENKSLDLVYIDADHRPDYVRADIQAWYPKLKPTGKMAGHDFSLPGVCGVLAELLGELKVYADDSWVEVKRR